MTKKAKATASKEQFLHDALLDWFVEMRRNFPWREGQIDPFVSLVTELMLQRTRAEVVAVFYPVLLEHLSTPAKILQRDRALMVRDLSALGLQDRRTDALKALASVVQEEYGGVVPPNEDKLLALSGVGPYIARAVLCFAFGKPVSIVDGNVTRVFCRFFNIENKGDNRRNKAIWEKADDTIALDPDHVKEFNWALLDFGAMVCVPRSPGCEACCLNERCSFYSSGTKKK
jgi:A/G-specific adenine glycosylase